MELQTSSASFFGDTIRDMNELLGQIGGLQTRLVHNRAELEAAQKLRFRVFSEEFGTKFDESASKSGMDVDLFDEFSDHLIVIDTNLPGPDHSRVVGTYRFTMVDGLCEEPRLYTAQEFNVTPLLSKHGDLRFMELGRSCVLPEYRGRRTVGLLWQGIWSWCRNNDVDVMIGCASFAGVVPQAHALGLSFLHHKAMAKDKWAVRAHETRHISMDMMPAEAIDDREALMSLPPLIKGYVRLGAKFGDGAVVDPLFRTTDVLVILPVDRISARYVSYYREDAGRFRG